MSGNNGLSYFYSDHLGSSSALQMPDSSVAYTWYLPFGGYRGSTPTQTITDRDFTGQKENMELGLLYYGARFYVPGLGRFISADTIIPNPANPQSYNRYAYVLNRALNFTDPTGHRECDLATGDCDSGAIKPAPRLPSLIKFNGDDGQDWTAEEKAAILSGAWQVAKVLFEASGGQFDSPREAFLAVYGGTVTFSRDSRTCMGALGYDCWASAGRHQVTVYSNAGTIDSWLAIYELGHSFNANTKLTEGDFWGEGYKNLAQEGVYAPDGTFLAGNTNPGSYSDNDTYIRTGLGYQGTDKAPYPYRQHWDAFTVEEDYADMFMNYVNNSFAQGDYGTARYAWMDSHMPAWINLAVKNNQ